MYSVNKIIETLKRKNYLIFSDKRGYDLNIVGIRTNDNSSNKFNDWLNVFYYFDNNWNHFAFPCTTDPGTFYRENPMNISGTAIMAPGQHRGVYMVGLHKGYKALQQKSPIPVYRDNNKDGILNIENMEIETGMFGVDIHRSNELHPSIQVDKWSAGCQVVQDPIQYDFFINLCEKSASIYGNSFSYTLLKEDDFIGG